LDAFDTVFVWIGSQSTSNEKEQSISLAQNYVNTAPDNRGSNVSIVRITAGNEPLLFTQHFIGWDNELTNKK